MAFYSFVIAHGGLIPMWDKFFGLTPNTTTVVSGTVETKTPTQQPTTQTGTV